MRIEKFFRIPGNARLWGIVEVVAVSKEGFWCLSDMYICVSHDMYFSIHSLENYKDWWGIDCTDSRVLAHHTKPIIQDVSRVRSRVERFAWYTNARSSLVVFEHDTMPPRHQGQIRFLLFKTVGQLRTTLCYASILHTLVELYDFASPRV